MARSSGSAGRGELLRHARSAEDWELLTGLWDHEGWGLVGTEPEAFAFAYAGVSKAARHQHAPLMLAGAVAEALLAISSDPRWSTGTEAVRRGYMQMGSAFLQNRFPVRSPSQLAQLLTAGMVARRSDGRLHEARELATEAAHQIGRAREVESPRRWAEQEAWLQLQWGLTQMQSGSHDLALEKTVNAHQLSPTGIVGASSAALLSAMHAISGEAGTARRWLAAHEAVDLTDHWTAGFAELPARLSRAMLALDRLDTAAAESELAETSLDSEAGGLWPLILTVHTRHALQVGQPMAMLSRLHHARRVLARHLKHRDGVGRQVLDRCSIELMLALGEVHRIQSRFAEDRELPPWLRTPAARFHLMTGNGDQAVRIAATSVCRKDIHVRDRQELLTISALAFRRQGRTAQMLESFSQAHALGETTGNLEPLLTIHTAVRQELLDATGLELPDDDRARLDAAPSVYPDHAELLELSRGELEVLHQIRDQETAAEVAKVRSVSVNTVKKQLATLYAKLGVHDRSSALERAQSIGLIHEPGVTYASDLH
jgi:LuxR family maltose regulon positive regulatory protein